MMQSKIRCIHRLETMMLPVDAEFRQKIVNYAVTHGGVLYSPILHPDLADLPYTHGADRFEVMRPYIPASAKTVLDIGAHWGYWSHVFEDLGMSVTTVESSTEAIYFLNEIKRLTGKKFTVVSGDVLDMTFPPQDIVLALNIFHHFLKKKPLYERFQAFLRRLDCKMMIYQAHDMGEGQMRNAYKNFSGEQMCQFIVANTALTNFEEVGSTVKRKVYRIWNKDIS
jgi:2-polyprenyl-3-methyl-5-hydroxy-6-metoxy-1,4-benzoquinol methylase